MKSKRDTFSHIDAIEVKIDSLKELIEQRFEENQDCHDRVAKHLETLNGQVAKNTEWRIKVKTMVSFWGFIIPVVVSVALAVVSNKII